MVWPRESFPKTLTVIVAIGAVIVVLAAGFVAAGVAMATGTLSVTDLQHHPPRIPVDFELWSQFAIYVPIVLYLLVVIRPVSALSFRALGLHRPTAGQIGAGILGAVAMWVTIALASWLVERLVHRHDTEAAIELLKAIRTSAQQIAFIVVAVVLAPLVEEFAFRVFLFNAVRRYAPFWMAALTSSCLFGLAHVQSPTQIATVGVPLACGGVVLATVYERTRSYWSSVLSHSAFNLVSIVAVFGFHVKP